MREIVELTGMVIKTMPIGEYDRRITLITKERGKVSAFVKGARHQSRGLLGNTLPFVYGIFRFYEGRNSLSLCSAEIIKYFDEVKADIQRTCYGSYFLELADYYGREYLPEQDALKLLYVALLALTKASIPYKLTRRIFELRIMAINGEYDPMPEELKDEAAKYAWHFIINTEIVKLYTFNLSNKAFFEIEKCIDRMMNKFIDKNMHSLEVLKEVCE